MENKTRNNLIAGNLKLYTLDSVNKYFLIFKATQPFLGLSFLKYKWGLRFCALKQFFKN